MKILLDECVPWPIRKVLIGHECTTAQRCGWGGMRNGELLQHADAQFDLFVTADRGIRFQQNLMGRKIPILQLSTNKLRPIMAAADLIRAAVSALQSGEVRYLQIP